MSPQGGSRLPALLSAAAFSGEMRAPPQSKLHAKLIPDLIGKPTVWSFPPLGQKAHSCADGLMSRACTWMVDLDIGFVILRELACLVPIKSSKHGGVRGHFGQWPHRVPSGTVEKLVRFNQTRVYPRHFNDCRIKRLI